MVLFHFVYILKNEFAFPSVSDGYNFYKIAFTLRRGKGKYFYWLFVILRHFWNRNFAVTEVADNHNTPSKMSKKINLVANTAGQLLFQNIPDYLTSLFKLDDFVFIIYKIMAFTFVPFFPNIRMLFSVDRSLNTLIFQL